MGDENILAHDEGSLAHSERCPTLAEDPLIYAGRSSLGDGEALAHDGQSPLPAGNYKICAGRSPAHGAESLTHSEGSPVCAKISLAHDGKVLLPEEMSLAHGETSPSSRGKHILGQSTGQPDKIMGQAAKANCHVAGRLVLMAGEKKGHL